MARRTAQSASVAVEAFDAAGLRGLSERFPHGSAHRYRLRDPATAPTGPAAMGRYASRGAGDFRVTAVAERLGMAVGIVEPGIEAFCFSDLRAGAMALTPPGAAEPVVGRARMEAAVARRFGFSHVGRFATSYARQFGGKPRRG